LSYQLGQSTNLANINAARTQAAGMKQGAIIGGLAGLGGSALTGAGSAQGFGNLFS